MKYRDFYLNPNQVFANSEHVLRFSMQIFNKYIARVGNYENEAPDMAIMSMRECLDSMRRLGTKDLFDVVSTLVRYRIEQLEDRDDTNLNYLDRTSRKKGIKFLKSYQEMFDILKTPNV